MKKYIEPSVKVYEIQINQMICESLPINNTNDTVDGASALSKHGNIWSFMDGEEEED